MEYNIHNYAIQLRILTYMRVITRIFYVSFHRFRHINVFSSVNMFDLEKLGHGHRVRH